MKELIRDFVFSDVSFETRTLSETKATSKELLAKIKTPSEKLKPLDQSLAEPYQGVLRFNKYPMVLQINFA